MRGILLFFFRLSFGRSDSLRDAIISLQELNSLPTNITSNDLSCWLNDHKNDTMVRHTLDFLPKNVPYWFLRPWINVADAKEIMCRSQSFENNCLYKLTKEDDTMWVELNSKWLPYLKENYMILKDFAYWHLSSFLQVRNPNVPDIATKLVKLDDRQALTRQRNLWDFVLEQSRTMNCIYTGKVLSVGHYDLDQFIPWSFVSPNLLWNLIPVDRSINSSKSDRLHDMDRYLLPYAQTHQMAVRTCIEDNYRDNELLDDYLLLGCTPQELSQMSKTNIVNCFKRAFAPMSPIAQNIGYELWGR